jgi:hypothetical protein
LGSKTNRASLMLWKLHKSICHHASNARMRSSLIIS